MAEVLLLLRLGVNRRESGRLTPVRHPPHAVQCQIQLVACLCGPGSPIQTKNQPTWNFLGCVACLRRNVSIVVRPVHWKPINWPAHDWWLRRPAQKGNEGPRKPVNSRMDRVRVPLQHHFVVCAIRVPAIDYVPAGITLNQHTYFPAPVFSESRTDETLWPPPSTNNRSS